MARIAILGAGVMGSAMAVPLGHGGHAVDLVGTPLDDEIVQTVGDGRPHPGLKVYLGSHVTAHHWTALESVLSRGVDALILGVSSAGIEWALNTIADALIHPLPLVVLTKGLIGTGDTIEIIPHLIERELKRRLGFAVQVLAIGGPCIAGELAAERDTSVILAGEDAALVERMATFLKAPFYHLYRSEDVIGVEVCAAFKNFFALGVGAAASAADNMPEAVNKAAAHNVVASTFTQAVAEMAVLVEEIGGRRETAFGLAGVGDLHVTCTAGRNSRMGRLLGRGISYTRAKAEEMPTDTVEGAQLALTLCSTLENMIAQRVLGTQRLQLTSAILRAVCRDDVFDVLAISRGHDSIGL